MHHGGHGPWVGWQRKAYGIGGGRLLESVTGQMQGEKQLSEGCSGEDGFYTGWRITTTHPPGVGTISGYRGATKTITVSLLQKRDASTAPNLPTSDATEYTLTNLSSFERHVGRCPFKLVCLPLTYSGHPGVNRASHRGW